MNNIFFDLDGTLINSGDRLYSLFQFLVPKSNLSYNEYWNLKRNKNTHEMILSKLFDYDKKQIFQFEQQWLTLIETEEYLSKDYTYPNVLETLKNLKQRYTLYLVTARQNIENTISELKRLLIFNYFEKILITERKYTKNEIILKNIKDLSKEDIIVGDTGKDVQVGKLLNIRTIVVTNGFLNETILKSYNPDKLINDLKELNNV